MFLLVLKTVVVFGIAYAGSRLATVRYLPEPWMYSKTIPFTFSVLAAGIYVALQKREKVPSTSKPQPTSGTPEWRDLKLAAYSLLSAILSGVCMLLVGTPMEKLLVKFGKPMTGDSRATALMGLILIPPTVFFLGFIVLRLAMNLGLQKELACRGWLLVGPLVAVVTWAALIIVM